MTGNKVKPYAKLDVCNGIELVFWRNKRESKDQKIFHVLDPQIAKGWKDQEGVWQNKAINLNMNDLYRLITMASEIKKIEDQFKRDERAKQNPDP